MEEQLLASSEEMYCWKPMKEWLDEWEWHYVTVWELIDELWKFDKDLKVLVRRTPEFNDEADANPYIDLMRWRLRGTNEDILLIN